MCVTIYQIGPPSIDRAGLLHRRRPSRPHFGPHDRGRDAGHAPSGKRGHNSRHRHANEGGALITLAQQRPSKIPDPETRCARGQRGDRGNKDQCRKRDGQGQPGQPSAAHRGAGKREHPLIPRCHKVPHTAGPPLPECGGRSPAAGPAPVSYKHLTLPTRDLV